MSDAQRVQDFRHLDPTVAARVRMEARLLRDLDAAESSLVEEWLSLVRLKPLAAVGYATAAALVLLLTSPLGALTLALLG